MIQEAFLELKNMSLYVESTHEDLAANNHRRFIHSSTKQQRQKKKNPEKFREKENNKSRAKT